jgi:soluble lytic murein transglycosylase-like protein
MSKFKVIRVQVPDLKTAYKSGNIDYSSAKDKTGNIAMIKRIDRDYGSLIDYWKKVFEIPQSVIIGFIATESGGRMLPPNKFNATGLMQVTAVALWEGVKKWKSTTKTDLPPEVVAELNKKTPEILSSKLASPSAAMTSKILTVLKNDAGFNIMAGTLVLRWNIERFSTSITGGQLNKALVAYNAGAYTRSLNVGTNPILQPIDTLVLATSAKVPIESRNYLYKMMGKDGFLDLIYNQNAL